MKRSASENLEDTLGPTAAKIKTIHHGLHAKEDVKISMPSCQQRSFSKFSVLPLEKYDNSFPYYREPFEIGQFSVDENRKFHNNGKKLKIYKPPDTNLLNFDLKCGYKTFKARDEEVQEKLDHLLNWVNSHHDKFYVPGKSNSQNGQKCLNTDFITWRGHLVKMLCTPYETREPWQMNACKYNGTIYISEVETEVRKKQRHSQTERQKEMCYWGYKFEDYMTRPFPSDGNETSSGICHANRQLNNSEAFCSVIRSRLNKHSIVIGAEVDCCNLENGKFKAPDSYIELKTSRIIDHPNQRRNFSRFKLKKFWAQSYLAGVPKIICGMRNDDGIVKKLETYKTMEIPRIANSNNGEWSASICMNFLDSLLHWMKDVVIKDDMQTTYSFKFEEPFEMVTARELQLGSDTIIPDWFVL